MAFWEYEMTLKCCEELAEEEKKNSEEQESKYSPHKYQRQAQQMTRGYNNSMPKMPSIPSMPKMPSIPHI